MARAPFARRFVSDYGSLRTDDDIAPFTRDSEQDCRSSSVSEVETSRNASKFQDNRPTCSSETPSTSDAAKSTRSRKRRGLKPRIVEIPVNRKVREEKQPLLRNREENNSLNDVQVQIPTEQDRSANTLPKASSTEQSLTRDSEQDCRSSSVSGVETSRNASKSQDNRPTCSSETPSTSDAAKSTPRKRRGRIVEIPVSRKDGRREEKQPLLRNREENNNLNNVQVQIPTEQDRSANTLPKASSTERFCSVFIVFLLPFIGGLTLIISVHIKSDVAARDINPAVFHYYKIVLISVFILWNVVLRCRNSNPDGANGNFEPVIPSHLLNGLALFGVCYTAFEVIVMLDWFKCSRSISGLGKTYPVSAAFEMLFVYAQLYVFYTLSRKRKRKLWFGSYFTMFTLSINLTLWAGYFCAGAVNHPAMQNVTWLRHYYYGKDKDLCGDFNNTGSSSRDLHGFVKGMTPYQYTFAMEYSLLASALLLHVWELAISSPRELEQSAANGVEWDVWRFGFIAGLFSLPLMGSVCVLSTSEYNKSNTAAFYGFQAVLFVLIFVCSVRGLWLLTKYYKRIRNVKALKIDLILLCSSALGFLVVDLFTFFASVAEMLKSYHGYMLILGLISLGELVAIFSLTAFIFASYFYRAPLVLSEDGYQAVGMIRQIASFCITVSFGFWVTRTYGFRSKYYFDVVGWEYFGTTWFAITLFSAPMCIFYHFHCAVCLSGIIADSTVSTRTETRT